MKKLTTLLSITSMIFLLSGCSNPAVPQGRNEDLLNYTVSDADDVILE